MSDLTNGGSQTMNNSTERNQTMNYLSDAGSDFNLKELNSLPKSIKEKLAKLRNQPHREQAEYALFYGQCGVPVFPLRSDSKKPHIKGWQDEATDDPDTIADWFCVRFPGAMIGCPAGAMGGLASPGLILIDVDVKNNAGGMETLERLERELGLKLSDLTFLTAHTPSGGLHYWLRWPEGVEIRNRGGKYGLGEGLDIRGCDADGASRGYGILPPSRNATDGSYRWYGDPPASLAFDLAICPPVQLLWRLVFNDNEREQLAKAGIPGPGDMPCDPPGWRAAYEQRMRKTWTATLPRDAQDASGVLQEPYAGVLANYLEKALSGELRALSDTPEGSRNTQMGNSALSLHGLLMGARIAGLATGKVEALEERAFEGYVEACSGLGQEEPPRDRWERCREDAHARDLKRVLCDPRCEFNKIEETAEDLAAWLDAVIEDPEAIQDKRLVIKQCAKLRHLDALEYDPRRKLLMKALGVQAKTLENAVQKAAKQLNLSDRERDELSGDPLVIQPREPCTGTVNGAALIDKITTALRRHVIVDEDAARMAALWTVFTYVHSAERHCPLLAIQAATKGAGKTTMLDVIGHLVEKPLSTVSATEASIFRAVSKWEPTLLADEADTWLTNNEELRGLFNAGFGPRGQAYVLRCVGDDHKVQQFSAWCPKAVAGIGKLPDTVQDRALVVALRRMHKGETVEKLDEKAEAVLDALASEIARWALDNIGVLRETRIDDLDELGPRENDKWRPLLRIAAACGRLEAAHATAVAIQRGQRTRRDSEDEAIMLLRHAVEVFEVLNAESLNPETLRQCLVGGEQACIPRRRGDEADVYDEIEAITEGYWRDCDPHRPGSGRELTMKQMSVMLKGLELASERKKVGGRDGTVQRHYSRQPFQEVLARYS